MVENKRYRDRTVIRGHKSILIKEKSAGKAATNSENEEIQNLYRTNAEDKNHVVCTICNKRVLRVISHLRYHLMKEHNIELSERDVLINFMPKEATEDSHNYYFIQRRPDILVVTPGSGKRR